jgi:hypothetical protein
MRKVLSLRNDVRNVSYNRVLVKSSPHLVNHLPCYLLHLNDFGHSSV